ncbi:MAG: hypothetical protein ACLQGP_23395 [Isosphaeraceae bacterium]
MRRKAASSRKIRTNRARPVLESLEGRQLLSGIFSHKDSEFSYTTPTGGHATIKIVGIGNLAGTTVDNSGALHLEYGGTNAYSKVVGQIQGGGGRGPLASILNNQLVETGQANSTTGEGGNPLAAVLMKNFDLIAGGKINLTPGVTSVVLDSIGANTQLQLRTLPPAPSYRILPPAAGNTAGGEGSLFGIAASTSSSVTAAAAASKANSVSSSSTTSSTTLEAGQTASITSAQGITTKYTSNANKSQTLTSVSGKFAPTTNIVESLAPGQPATEPPAPPGLVLKANSIDGGGAQTATIDIQGNVQSIRVGMANGLVIDDAGNLNLVKSNQMDNATIIGRPLSHLEIAIRSNTTVYSTYRDVGTRNGVIVVSSIPVNDPLSEPAS